MRRRRVLRGVRRVFLVFQVLLAAFCLMAWFGADGRPDAGSYVFALWVMLAVPLEVGYWLTRWIVAGFLESEQKVPYGTK